MRLGTSDPSFVHLQLRPFNQERRSGKLNGDYSNAPERRLRYSKRKVREKVNEKITGKPNIQRRIKKTAETFVYLVPLRLGKPLRWPDCEGHATNQRCPCSLPGGSPLTLQSRSRKSVLLRCGKTIGRLRDEELAMAYEGPRSPAQTSRSTA